MTSSQPSLQSSRESQPPPNEDALLAAIAASSQTPYDSSKVPVDPTSTTISSSSTWSTLLSHPFSVTWRAALVRAPRLVPMSVLKFTCPEGPFPFMYNLKSPRGKHEIPLYVWVPTPDILLSRNGVAAGDALASGLPLIIDFHGGGFVLGSCLEQAPSCAQFCKELSAVVISVDYRMGPIDKFPAAIWDGEDVLNAVLDGSSPSGQGLRDAIKNRMKEEMKKWSKLQGKTLKKEAKIEKKEVKKERKEAKKERRPERPVASSRSSTSSTSSLPTIKAYDLFDTARIAVAGFSAGANLALNLGLDIKKPHLPESWPSKFPANHSSTVPFLLFYPSLDARQLPSQRTRPADMPPSSPFWTEVDDILMPSYLPRHQVTHPRASPGLADVETSLHPKAKALLVLPELDTLAEQSEAWIKKVYDSGRGDDLEVIKFPKMKHGWTQFPVSWLSEEERNSRAAAFRRAIDFVKAAWNLET